jgi:hypothetical protein
MIRNNLQDCIDSWLDSDADSESDPDEGQLIPTFKQQVFTLE